MKAIFILGLSAVLSFATLASTCSDIQSLSPEQQKTISNYFDVKTFEGLKFYSELGKNLDESYFFVHNLSFTQIRDGKFQGWFDLLFRFKNGDIVVDRRSSMNLPIASFEIRAGANSTCDVYINDDFSAPLFSLFHGEVLEGFLFGIASGSHIATFSL